MKDLSRLRRWLKNRQNVCEETLALLDVIDMVSEDAEVFEDQLRQSAAIDEHALYEYLNTQSARLAETLVGFIGPRVDLFQILLDEYGVHYCQQRVTAAKVKDESLAFLDPDAIGDLDDHPF